jgi:hypothetical protein
MIFKIFLNFVEHFVQQQGTMVCGGRIAGNCWRDDNIEFG